MCPLMFSLAIIVSVDLDNSSPPPFHLLSGIHKLVGSEEKDD